MKKIIILLFTISAVALLGGCNIITENKTTQRIEIWSAQENKVVRTINDQDQIDNFFDNVYEYTEYWSDLGYSIPDAEPLYCFTYWQRPTRTLFGFRKDLVISSQETLYKDSDGSYYLYTEIDEEVLPSVLYDFIEDFDANSMTEKIPDETASYLIKIADGAEVEYK